MKLSLLSFSLLWSLSLAACASPRMAAPPTTPPTPTEPKPLGVEAKAKFDAALADFIKHDEAHDWAPVTCAAVANMFDAAAAAQGSYPRASFNLVRRGLADSAPSSSPISFTSFTSFNAGLAHQRCGSDADARRHFEQAVKEDPAFPAARAKLALYRLRDDGDLDAAIDTLDRAVAEGRFTDVAAMVDLAAIQMTRDSSERRSPKDCKDDMECAKLNLHRALAIDDAYMPAHNELALYYLQLARKRATGGAHTGRARQVLTPTAARRKSDVQQLELAALVCSQAIEKNPRYAPIHNTAGLIQYELGRINGAVAEFGRAAELDPKFFEAQMNYAAVNLGFRGFEQAQAAYKRAIDARPNDYEAHLGMAVALRGPITGNEAPSEYGAKLAAVESELAAAKKIDQSRPDAFYNEGIFVQEFKARGDKASALAALDQAEASFKTFLDRARGKAEYADAVARANDRLKDIATMRAFLP